MTLHVCARVTSLNICQTHTQMLSKSHRGEGLYEISHQCRWSGFCSWDLMFVWWQMMKERLPSDQHKLREHTRVSQRRGWRTTGADCGWFRLWPRRLWCFPAASHWRCWWATGIYWNITTHTHLSLRWWLTAVDGVDGQFCDCGCVYMSRNDWQVHWSYLSCGACFCEPGPAVGMGPGWKAWLGEVVAERARWGEAWPDWEPERGPPIQHNTTQQLQ